MWLGRAVGFDDFSVLVLPAGIADVMWPLELPTIGTFGVGRRRQTVVSAPHVPLRFGDFSLWNSHELKPFLYLARGLRRVSAMVGPKLCCQNILI